MDLAAGSLAVRRTASKGESGTVLRDETKTSWDRRLELLPMAVEALTRHRIYQNQERLKYRGL